MEQMIDIVAQCIIIILFVKFFHFDFELIAIYMLVFQIYLCSLLFHCVLLNKKKKSTHYK